jgi:general secretion pathway protein G
LVRYRKLLTGLLALPLALAACAPTASDEGFPRLQEAFNATEHKLAVLGIARLSEMLELYRLDVGSYPTTEQGLQALRTRPSHVDTWQGPYADSDSKLEDPWHRRFVYRNPSSREGYDFDLCSYGLHGKPGGAGRDATVCNEHARSNRG